MEHEKCNELIKFNLNAIGRDYFGSRVSGFVILPEGVADREKEALRLLADPLVPASEVTGREYDLFVAFNYPEGDFKKPFSLIAFDQLDEAELYC